MPEFSFLQDILLLLVLALACGYLFSRLHLSPIVGYLVTGMLAGPHGLHLIEAAHEVELMAEIGVILLLFTIGLEFSFTRLLRLKRLMLVSGSAQILFTGILVYEAALWFGLSSSASLGLAMALALSSTAIVLKLLMEHGEVDTGHGRISLAILLFQDLCVVLFLIVMPLLGGRSSTFSPAGLLRSAGLLLALFIFARYLLQPVMRGLLRARSPELFRLTILALVLATAWITSLAGLSLALGAFLAGLALAESPYSHQALSDILPFRDTFLAVFFVSIGMLVDMEMLAGSWHLLLAFFLLLSLAKILTGTIAALFSSYPLRIALLSGLLLFQVGEFSFVLLRQALAMEILPEPVYQLTLAVIALSMVATPLIAGRAQAVAAGISGLIRGRGSSLAPVQEKTANLEGHVIIAGYGLTGRNVARVLQEMHIPYIHVELNGEMVRKARERGEFIVYGDATSPTVLQEVGIDRARAFVLAINDPSALARAVKAGRDQNPEIHILVRTRFVAELAYLTSLGADEIIPDELEASLQLSATLLKRCGIAEGRIMQLMTSLRQEHYNRLRQAGAEGDAGRLSVLEGGKTDFQAIPEDWPHLGNSLSELAFRNRTGAMVVGVIRHERTIYSPPADLQLARGDTLILLGDEESLDRARDFIHEKREEEASGL